MLVYNDSSESSQICFAAWLGWIVESLLHRTHSHSNITKRIKITCMSSRIISSSFLKVSVVAYESLLPQTVPLEWHRQAPRNHLQTLHSTCTSKGRQKLGHLQDERKEVKGMEIWWGESRALVWIVIVIIEIPDGSAWFDFCYLVW